MGEATSDFDLEQWVGCWDQRIGAWIAKGPSEQMGCEAIRRCYRGSRDRAIDDHAMPEPYVGDPLAPESAGVFLNLNPGVGIAPQRWEPRGALVDRVLRDGYYRTYSRWTGVPAETVRWWARSAQWARRQCPVGAPSAEPGVVGIDLFPWHSKSFGVLRPDDAALDWLDRNVLSPAAHIGARSHLGRRTSASGAALVVAVGAAFTKVLPRLGFDLLASVDRMSGPRWFSKWPPRADGRPTERAFNLYRSGRHGLLVLETHARGGNTLPGVGFDPVVDEFLRQNGVVAGGLGSR